MFHFLITFFFYGCASIGQKNSPPAKYSSDCQVNVQILKSFGDTIRIEYNPSNMATADKFASDYCLIERKKNRKTELFLKRGALLMGKNPFASGQKWKMGS